MELGTILAELRKRDGYSQEWLAEKLGVSRQAVAKWEAGGATPELSKLIALADLFDVSLDRLAGRKETDLAALKERITELSDRCVRELDCDVTPMIRRYLEFMEELSLPSDRIVEELSRLCAEDPHRKQTERETVI